MKIGQVKCKLQTELAGNPWTSRRHVGFRLSQFHICNISIVVFGLKTFAHEGSSHKLIACWSRREAVIVPQPSSLQRFSEFSEPQNASVR